MYQQFAKNVKTCVVRRMKKFFVVVSWGLGLHFLTPFLWDVKYLLVFQGARIFTHIFAVVRGGD